MFEEHPTRHGAPVRHVVDGLFNLPIRRVETEDRCDAVDAARRIVADDVAAVGVAQRHGIGEHGIEDVLEVEGRAAHRLEHVADGSLALGRLVLLPHQPCEAHGDAGLPGKDRDRRDLLVTERVDAVAPEAHDADDVAVDDDGQAQDGPVPGQALPLSPAVLRVGQDVVDVHRRSLEGHAPHARFGTGRDRVLAFVLADVGRHPAVRHQPEQVAIPQVDVAGIGRAELCRALRDLLEDRRELEATVDDGMQNFADGGQRLGAAIARGRRCAGGVLGEKRFGHACSVGRDRAQP